MKEQKPKQHYIDNFGWNSCCAANGRKCTCPSWYRIAVGLPGANLEDFLEIMKYDRIRDRETSETELMHYKEIFGIYLARLAAESRLEQSVQSLGHIDLWD